MNHHAMHRRAIINEMAFKAVLYRAGEFYGDPKGARRHAALLADDRILDHADRRTFIDQASHTLQFGPNR